MTVDEILNTWKDDAEVDRLELGEAAMTVSNLHAKYLSMLFFERARYIKLTQDFNSLKKVRWEYWNGILSNEDLKERGWKPQPLRILKQDIPMYLESDEVLMNLQLQMNLQREKINILEDILKHLSQRGYNIGNAIKWTQMTSGGQ